MGFSIISSNRVQSDQGFSVWMRNPFNLHYFEGARELIVPGEMLTGEKELLVSVSAIKKWKPPFDRETIDKPKQEQITANLTAALEFLGIRFELD